MNRHKLDNILPGQQSGAVLVFSLIFLILLTVVASNGMETTILEERMASNMQDYNRAFQAAEASLETGELWLENQIFLPELSIDGSTMVWDNAGLDPDTDTDEWWEERSPAWWTANSRKATGMSGVAAQPEYIIEEFFESVQGQALNLGTGDEANSRTFHRVTARGIGGSTNTQVMLQTTFVRPYD